MLFAAALESILILASRRRRSRRQLPYRRAIGAANTRNWRQLGGRLVINIDQPQRRGCQLCVCVCVCVCVRARAAAVHIPATGAARYL